MRRSFFDLDLILSFKSSKEEKDFEDQKKSLQ